MEAPLPGQVLERHHLPGSKGEPGLSPRVGRNDRLPDVTVLPANPRAQQQELAPRLQLQDMAKLDLKRLRDEHDGLIEQGGDIIAHHGKLAQGGDDGLLERTVEQGLLRPLAFLDTFLL